MTIITITGGYDDMVVAKTQIRSKVEADNAQREKKIDQLEGLHRAVLAGTREPGVRRKGQPADDRLARSNIQRPHINFKMNRPRAAWRGDWDITKGFGAGRRRQPTRSSTAAKIVIAGAATASADDAAEGDPGRRRVDAAPNDRDEGTIRFGHSLGRLLPQATGLITKGMTAAGGAPVRSTRRARTST